MEHDRPRSRDVGTNDAEGLHERDNGGLDAGL